MNSKQRWLGWVAIGVGALALLAALFGQGFGPLAMAAGRGSAGAAQGYAQQAPAQQGAGKADGQQQGTGAQQAPAQPGAAQGNVQQGRGRRGDGQQNAPAAPGASAQRGGAGRQGGGQGGWLRLPFGLGASRLGMLALLAAAGVWLLRGRKAAAPAASGQPAAPEQGSGEAPLSPTGEAYIEEPGEQE